MIKNLAMIFFLIGYPCFAANISQSFGNASLSNITHVASILATNEFIIGSTWLGNSFGIVDSLAWLLDFASGYLFYAKGDNTAVSELKAEIKEYKERRHSTHQDILRKAASLIGKIRANIQHEKYQGTSGLSNKERLREQLVITIDVLEHEIDPNPNTIVAF